MKIRFFLALCLLASLSYAEPSYESYLNSIQKVTTLLQTISQKLMQDMSSTSTRSISTFSKEAYCTKMIDEIKKEIAQMTDNKNPNQLSQEDKDLIAMLEAYIEQLQIQAESSN